MSAPYPVPEPGYHLAGLGGVGMSALAEFLIDAGQAVSGSDRLLEGPAIRPLTEMGVQVFPQDGSGLAPGKILVCSTAIEEDNPDLLRARDLGLELLHRAEVIARVAEGKRVVAVSGTAGKTTMTALLGWILTSAGLDPSVINGGILLNWRGRKRLGASRVGQSDLFVVEADESDRSLLRLHPKWAIVSNFARDHFNYEDTVALFREFAGQCREGIIAGPGVSQILDLNPSRLDVREIFAADVSDGYARIEHDDYSIPLPGLHNAINAGLVISCCRRLGVSAEAVKEGLASFAGIHRRLEKLGRFSEMDVYDDYAHNSMKMKAAIETLQLRYPVLSVFWRPHGFGPLRMMFDDLCAMFTEVLRPEDRLFILPVFYSGGTADASLNSDQLVYVLKQAGAPVDWVGDYAALSASILDRASKPGALLGMGARDPQITEFLRGLVV